MFQNLALALATLATLAAFVYFVTTPGDMAFECRQRQAYACSVEECPTAPSAPSEECIALLREIGK
jgi:hypothetical protein